MTTALPATTDDPIAAILIAGSLLVLLFLVLRGSRRARAAEGRSTATGLQRADAAAAAVEEIGRDYWFKCTTCRKRTMLRGLAPGDFLERLIDQYPQCPACEKQMAVFEQELAS